MKLRAMVAGVLVAMVLSTAFAGPACGAACGMVAAGGQGTHGTMQMAGMAHCAMCQPRPAVAARVAPCGQETAAGVVESAGAKAPAVVRTVLERVEASPAPARVGRLAVEETPPLQGNPVSLHTTLRV